MKTRLIWKLLLTNIFPVILIIILVVWLAIDHLAAGYFMDLMDNYAISPTEIHQMFLTSIHHYLIWASLVALLMAALLSYILTRRVLKPLSQMTSITRKFGTGDFSSRVEVTTGDEIGQLGEAFNSMADSLEQVEQLRKNMVADAAHELRTPLTNLCGYLEALDDGVMPPSPGNIRLLHQESLQLKNLVDDLQQVARADAAQYVLHRTLVHPAEEMEHLYNLYSHRLEEKGIRVSCVYEDVPPIMADRDKLLQALRNLFENCWKYTPEAGWIELRLRNEQNRVSFILSNSGPGIPAADLPFIFERFYRTDRSRAREAGGFGLGLTIAKQLVEAHGGTVGAESRDGATTIWLTLPR